MLGCMRPIKPFGSRSAITQTAIFPPHLPTLDLSFELNGDLHPIVRNVCADKVLLLFHFCRSKHFSLNEQCTCFAYKNVITYRRLG